MSRSPCPTDMNCRPVLESLEAKLLYAADLAPLALSLADAAAGAHVQSLAPMQAAVHAAQQSQSHELIFVDAGVPDLASLLDDFAQQQRQGRDVTVVVIDASDDGIARISQTLSTQSELSAVHVISHGDDGTVQLGKTRLDSESLSLRASEIAQWSLALNARADLLLYGCDVAAHEQGRTFVNDLAMLTGADVAASTDLTGTGGNWALEQRTGQIDSALALSQTAAQQWQGQLALAVPISKGVVVTGDANAGKPVSLQWDGLTTSGSSSTAQASNWTIVTSAAAPDGQSGVVLGVTDDGNGKGTIAGQRWSAGTWSAMPINPLGVNALTNRQSFAVAYEQTSGDAMVVWNEAGALKYATYTSQGWSGPQVLAAYTGASPDRIQIAAQPKGDQLLLTVSDGNVHDRALVWNGASWGHEVVLDISGGQSSEQLALSPVYESVSGDATVVYAKSGDNKLYTRVFQGNTWGPEVSVNLNISGQPLTLVTAADPNSDRIALGVLSVSGVGFTTTFQQTFARWTGTAWDASTQVDGTFTYGTSAQSVAFESISGDMLVAYAGTSTAPTLLSLARNSTTWSAPITGPDQGGSIGVVKLFADPASDHIMLGTQGTNGKLIFSQWNGQAIATSTVISGDTGSGSTPAFTWLWQANSANAVDNGLWLGSASSGTGWPGVNQVSAIEALSVDTQGLTLGPNGSAGTLSHAWNPAAFGANSMDDFARVSQAVSMLNGFDLQRGDILFGVASSISLTSSNSVSVNNNDVVRFRPTTPGDYRSGEFKVIVSGISAGLLGLGSAPDVTGLAVVEQDVTLGDVQLHAGDLLFSAGHGSTARDIYLFSYQKGGLLGQVLTSSTTLLLAGNDIGLSKGIAGLEIITAATTLGGQALTKGELLITIDDNDTLGSNNQSAQVSDVIRLKLSKTSVNGTAQGTATLLIDGSAMGLPGNTLDGLALLESASPEITSGTNPIYETTLPENQPVVTTVVAQDSQGGNNITYGIGGGADAAMFTINSAGVLRFKSQSVPDFEAPSDASQDGVYEVIVTATEGSQADQQLIRLSITDVNEAPVMATGTVAVSSTELQQAVAPIEASDPEGQALTYSISGGVDAGLFEINASSGLLSFKAAPDTHAAPYATHALSYAVQVAASDGTFTVTRDVDVTLNKVNRPPVNTLPGALSTQEDTTTVLSGLAVHDEDAGNTPITVTLSVLHGTLSLDTQVNGGIVASQVQSSDGGRSWVIQASTLAINATLSSAAGLLYTSEANYNGGDTLTVNSNDGGSSGVPQQPDQRSDTDTAGITVQAVDDAPTLRLNALTIEQGGAATPQLTVGDIDTADEQLVLTFSDVQAGRFTRLDTGLTLSSVTLAEFKAGQVRFVHDGSTTQPSYRLTVSDASGQTASAVVDVSFSLLPPPPAPSPPPAPAPQPIPSPEPVQEPAPSPAPVIDSSFKLPLAGVLSSTEVSVSEPLGQGASSMAEVVSNLTPRTAALGAAPAMIARVGFASAATPWRLEFTPEALVTVSLQPATPIVGVASPAPKFDSNAVPELTDVTLKWAGALQGGSLLNDLRRSLNTLHEDLTDPSERAHPLMSSSIALSTGLSVGYVIWLVRGGALVGSMLSSMPLWNMVDPLPVLSRTGSGKAQQGRADEDDAPLENLFDGKGQTHPGAKPAMPPAPEPVAHATHANRHQAAGLKDTP
jgi:hypothetical protein